MADESLVPLATGRSDEAARGVRLRTRGTPMGPIVRLVNPHDIGEIIKPFVFLDLADIPPSPANAFRWHPHSGIATLTIIIEGQNEYRETTGVHGGLKPGGIEYMESGRGVWHTASAVGDTNLKGFQVWLLLPPGRDLLPPKSTYLVDAEVPRAGPARVILGAWKGAESPLAAPPDTTLLDISMGEGDRWSFAPPAGQDVAWIALYSGAVDFGNGTARAGDLVVFEDGEAPLAFETQGGAGFLVGAARRAPFPLHTGRHSVHVSDAALAAGEAEIARLATDLRASGIL